MIENPNPNQLSMPLERPTTPVVKNAITLWDAMKDRADQRDEDVFIYHGKVTELFRELGIPTMYYSAIRRFLVHCGCIEMVKRGARGTGSEVRLLHRPVPEDSTAEIVKIASERLTVGPESATLSVEFERRIRRLEKWRETLGGLNIAEAFRNQEMRIADLQTQVAELSSKTQDK